MKKNKELNYIEFRYTDGSMQKLVGKQADDWIKFNKKMIMIARKTESSYNPTWKWDRFDKIPEQPKPEVKTPEPIVKPKPVVKPKSKPKTIPKPKPNYSEYGEYD